MFWQFPVILLFAATALVAQKYAGPRPAKSDVPYLLHATNLVETEIAEAKEENRKDEIRYLVSGAASPARTPLASPIFVIQAEKIVPEKLQLYKLESKGGQREITFSRKKKDSGRAIRFAVSRLDDRLYRIEVDESLEMGEYSLTPDGTNQVFCFQVY
jgi:hypothetical protein